MQLWTRPREGSQAGVGRLPPGQVPQPQPGIHPHREGDPTALVHRQAGDRSLVAAHALHVMRARPQVERGSRAGRGRGFGGRCRTLKCSQVPPACQALTTPSSPPLKRCVGTFEPLGAKLSRQVMVP